MLQELWSFLDGLHEQDKEKHVEIFSRASRKTRCHLIKDHVTNKVLYTMALCIA